MFKPSLRSTTTLFVLGLVAVILFIFTQSQYTVVQDEMKLKAAEKMKNYMNILKEEVVVRGYAIDKVSDPNLTGLIGVKRDSSWITTSYGSISNRLTSLNPNFAAVFVEMFQKSGLKANDYIAVGLTGANPGANLALYAAIDVMNLRPIIITSVGSAEFGANREDFTWLDMERILNERGVIKISSKFASIGGNKDRGRGLGKTGRKKLREAISRNGLDPNDLLLKDGEDFVDKRFKAYAQYLPLNESYKLFVNIGGGYGNIGDISNAKLIQDGLNEKLAEVEFDNPGVLMKFAKTIPVLHMYNVRYFADKYRLPVDPEPLPETGTGKIFESRKINVTVAAICLGILVMGIVLVVTFDRKDRHFTRNIVDPDNQL